LFVETLEFLFKSKNNNGLNSRDDGILAEVEISDITLLMKIFVFNYMRIKSVYILNLKMMSIQYLYKHFLDHFRLVKY